MTGHCLTHLGRNVGIVLGLCTFLLTMNGTAQATTCDEAKLKAIGKKIACLTDPRKGDLLETQKKKPKKKPTRRQKSCVKKAERDCARAERKHDCSNPGNCDALALVADQCIAALLDEISSPPSSPSGAFVDLSEGPLD